MKRKKYYILFMLIAICCREKYVPKINSPSTGYLVVEGVINSGNGPTNINLSRTNQYNSDSLQHERGANVQVEGDDNSIYNLIEKANGMYSSDQLSLNNSKQYRLRIKTSNGQEYLSDFVSVKDTPPIDSVSWQYGDEGVNIFVSAHDAQNNARYYNWSYEETWEFHSTYVPTLKWDSILVGGAPTTVVVKANYDPLLYTCWSSGISHNILTSSTARLSEDILNNYPIASVQKGSIELSVLYSILVKQYALTIDAYEFLQRMKKNTEQTGSVFDPQPSELKGNIRSTSNASEIVLGYVSVCSEQTKRIFIKNSEVPNWDYDPECTKDPCPEKGLDIQQAVSSGLVPVDIISQDSIRGVTKFYVTRPQCVDCTLTGVNKKPSFWP